uniref:Transcriptional repressor NF-X1 n=1 Tax=Cajanus cajan TaxID=3821 RepID=A0A151R319_CAJCA|nr:Transcriptional repressor NF-X1 [Cajanus cajan]
MSSQLRRERRDGSRVPSQGATRQEWVPRRSAASTTSVQPSNLHSNNNADAGSSNQGVPVAPVTLHRSNHGTHRVESNHGSHRVESNHGPHRAERERERDKGRRSGNQVGRGLSLGVRDSSLPQLVQEIQEKLLKSTVECMICCEMVKRSAPVWSCSSCYAIFHLNCIKIWARAPISGDFSVEKNQGINWRCPGCQFVQLTSSKEIRYVCFCGKRTNPPSDLYLTPHSCGEPCGKPLEREVLVAGSNKDDLCPHSCVLQCHPGPCPPCKAFAPPRLCPCGKKTIATRCSDRRSVLTCGQCCGKLLECERHPCERICHIGPCDPCQVSINASCFCTKTTEVIPCGQMAVKGEIEAKVVVIMSVASIVIQAAVGNVSFYQAGLRHAVVGKQGWRMNGRVVWIRGHCPPCLETIFTELTCACGRTSILPPLPCGTPPPSCQLPCSVPQPCGHSGSHSCHFGDCPPCSVPVAKHCIGGHVVLRNIPCGSKDIRCNHLCGKTRQCGLHACGRTCHPPPCDNVSGVVQGFKAPCGQTCGAPRRCCRHMCMAPCHPSSPCPDIKCEFPVTITCSCGRITANVPCDAGGSSNNYNADAIHEASIIQTLPVPLQPVDANGKKVPLGQRKLMCDDECAKLERKRVLADAFDITPPSLDSLHFGENSLSSESLSDIFRRDPKWVLAVEERCKVLVLGKSRGITHGLKVHIFCPMPKENRDAVRSIAERWKLAINAGGWDPKRFIVISVTPKSKAPARVIGVKGTPTLSAPLPPVFDPTVDMDPRLVVSFPDLPRDADISALVLRFGGECELVWLNDKNALAVFHDPARAATAMRRLDHGTVYQGAVLVAPNVASSATNAWGGAGAAKGGAALASTSASRGNSWKKAVVQDSDWKEDSWGDEGLATGSVQPSVWKKEAPIAASLNRWNVLEHESGSGSSSSSLTTVRAEVSGKQVENSAVSTFVSGAGGSNGEGNSDAAEVSEVVDDWENAYE